MSPHSTAYPQPDPSLADLGGVLKRRWRWIAGPALIAFAASTVFVSVVSPRYTGEAKLLLQSGDSFFTRPGTALDRPGDPQQQFDEQGVASQVQVVMSRDLARTAIRKLGLVGNPEFDPLIDGLAPWQRLGVFLGLAKNPMDGPPEDRILDNYYDHLLVYPVGKSRIVSIEFRAKDPDLASRAANTIAELYLSQQEDAKKDTARSASTWLGTNIDDLRRRVADAEARVEAFRARTGLLLGSAGTSTLSAQQLGELSTQLAQARTMRSDSQAKAKLIRDLIKEGRTFDIPDVANNELVRRLFEQRINLQAQLALELRTLLPEHPRIKELKAQLGDLEVQIRGAAERTVRTLENDARIAGGRVEALEGAIDLQKKVVAQGNESEVQLRALDREARTQREQLETYLSRYREATARDAGNATPPDARIISRAVAPQIPSFPKKIPTIALATLAAIVLAAGAIVARELLGSPAPFRDAEPRPAGGREPFFGPSTTVDDAIASPTDPVEPRFDFDRLIARLGEPAAIGRARRVCVVGLDRRPDTNAIAIGLATRLAGPHQALLVAFEDDEAPASDVLGFTDLAAGEASFGDVIYRDPGSTLDRIGAGTLANDALRPADLDAALGAFDETYDWIVLVLQAGVDENLIPLLAPRTDSVVIASDLEPTDPALVQAYEAIQSAGAKDVIVAREQSAPAAEREAA